MVGPFFDNDNSNAAPPEAGAMTRKVCRFAATRERRQAYSETRHQQTQILSSFFIHDLEMDGR